MEGLMHVYVVRKDHANMDSSRFGSASISSGTPSWRCLTSDRRDDFEQPIDFTSTRISAIPDSPNVPSIEVTSFCSPEA